MVLDTCTVLWLTGDRTRLSGAAEAAIRRGREQGTLSIADVTLHEVALLFTRGRLPLATPIEDYLRYLERTFIVLPITASIALQANRLLQPFPKDPFDRLIAATAIVHQVDLVTKDQKIRDCGEVSCIW